MTKNWEIKTLTTSLLYIPDKSAETTSKTLNKAIQECAGLTQLVAFIVTDGASSQTKSINDLGITNWICVCHSLQLVVEEFYENNEVSKLINKPLEICKTIASHSSLCQQLESKSKYCILLPNQTRWNGVHYSLQRFLFLEKILKTIAEDEKNTQYFSEIEFPSIDEITDIKIVCNILDSFEKASVFLQGEKFVTLAMVPIIIENLLKDSKPDQSRHNGLALSCRKVLYEILLRRFADVFLQPNHALLSAKLTPYYYDLPFEMVTGELKDQLSKLLLDEYESMFGDKFIGQVEGCLKRDLPKLFEEYKKKHPKAKNEIEIASQILNFWKENSSLGAITELAKCYLSCPASSGFN